MAEGCILEGFDESWGRSAFLPEQPDLLDHWNYKSLPQDPFNRLQRQRRCAAVSLQPWTRSGRTIFPQRQACLMTSTLRQFVGRFSRAVASNFDLLPCAEVKQRAFANSVSAHVIG